MSRAKSHLIRVCAALVISAAVGATGVGLLLSALPAQSKFPWAYGSNPSETVSQVERQTALDGATEALRGSTAVRLLTASVDHRRFENAAGAFATSPKAGSPTDAEKELARAIRHVQEDSAGTAIVALVLFATAALSGLIGFLRLKVRGLTILSTSLLALATGGGVAVMAMMNVAPIVIVVPVVLTTLGLFGQLVATNLLPDSNHPFIVGAEQRLSALSAAGRRRYLLVRAGAGFGLSAAALLATLASYFLIDAPYFTAYTGAFATGLILAATPLIAFARVKRPAA